MIDKGYPILKPQVSFNKLNTGALLTNTGIFNIDLCTETNLELKGGIEC